MTAHKEERDGKRTIIVVTVILLIFDLVLGALAFFVGPLDLTGAIQQRVESDPLEEVTEPESREPTEVSPERTPERVTEERSTDNEMEGRPSGPSTHRVQPGDTLYDIAATVWGDQDLWPLIYLRNRPPLDHPDRIEPFDRLDLGADPLQDGEIGDAERGELLDGYLEAYSAYRRQGEIALNDGRTGRSNYLIQQGRLLVNKAQWLLYRGTLFDPTLLERYSDRIEQGDRRVVEEYLQRFGLPTL